MRYIVVAIVVSVIAFASVSENTSAAMFPLDATSIKPSFQSQQETAPGARVLQRKKPATAVLLAFFVPSAGHLYMEQWDRGVSYAVFEGVGLAIALTKYSDKEKENRSLRAVSHLLPWVAWQA